jgi:hypothetical protein
MRSLLSVAGRLAACVALVGCGPAVSGAGRGSAIQRPFVLLQGQPGCTFRVLQQIRVSPGPMESPRGLEFRARNMGADAVIDFHEDLAARQYGPRGQILSRTFEGTAVQFSDPSNPDCYR